MRRRGPQRPGEQVVISAAGPLLSLALGAARAGARTRLTDGTLPAPARASCRLRQPPRRRVQPAARAAAGRRPAAARRCCGRPPGSWHRGTVAAAWAGRGLAVARRGPPVPDGRARRALGGRPTRWSGPGSSRSSSGPGRAPSLKSAQVRQRLPALTGPWPGAPGHPRARDDAAGRGPAPDRRGRRPARGGRRRRRPPRRPSSARPRSAPRRRSAGPGSPSARSPGAWTRPWCSRRTCSGEDLVDAMAGNPATEYLVVDARGQAVRRAVLGDVERAFAAT